MSSVLQHTNSQLAHTPRQPTPLEAMDWRRSLDLALCLFCHCLVRLLESALDEVDRLAIDVQVSLQLVDVLERPIHELSVTCPRAQLSAERRADAARVCGLSRRGKGP